MSTQSPPDFTCKVPPPTPALARTWQTASQATCRTPLTPSTSATTLRLSSVTTSHSREGLPSSDTSVSIDSNICPSCQPAISKWLRTTSGNCKLGITNVPSPQTPASSAGCYPKAKAAQPTKSVRPPCMLRTIQTFGAPCRFCELLLALSHERNTNSRDGTRPTPVRTILSAYKSATE